MERTVNTGKHGGSVMHAKLVFFSDDKLLINGSPEVFVTLTGTTEKEIRKKAIAYLLECEFTAAPGREELVEEFDDAVNKFVNNIRLRVNNVTWGGQRRIVFKMHFD